MNYLKICTCCFFGHRNVNETPELIKKLTKITENLISSKKVDTFLFGSKSKFDKLCYKVVTKLKEKYPHIKRVYVRAEYADIDDSYTQYLLESYEETYYPEKIRGSGKASYVERNREMIDQSNFCIIYYDNGYLPPKTIKHGLTEYQPKSGTKIAYEYAIKNGIEIINVI